MSTTNQDQEFEKIVQSNITTSVNTSMVDEAVDFVASNFDPEDVFSESKLLSWAKNYDPEGIFDDGALSAWAESNGYVKEEK